MTTQLGHYSSSCRRRCDRPQFRHRQTLNPVRIRAAAESLSNRAACDVCALPAPSHLTWLPVVTLHIFPLLDTQHYVEVGPNFSCPVGLRRWGPILPALRTCIHDELSQPAVLRCMRCTYAACMLPCAVSRRRGQVGRPQPQGEEVWACKSVGAWKCKSICSALGHIL